MSVLSETDKDSGLGNRPLSEMLVDLHVYLIPSEYWVPERRLAKNHSIESSISTGFIRVLPELTLQDIRKEIAYQLGYDILPTDFVFLRSIGRNFAKVRAKQEKQLKAKTFMPPFALEPELYLLENLDLLHQTSLSELEVTNVVDRLNSRKTRRPRHVISDRDVYENDAIREYRRQQQQEKNNDRVHPEDVRRATSAFSYDRRLSTSPNTSPTAQLKFPQLSATTTRVYHVNNVSTAAVGVTATMKVLKLPKVPLDQLDRGDNDAEFGEEYNGGRDTAVTNSSRDSGVTQSSPEQSYPLSARTPYSDDTVPTRIPSSKKRSEVLRNIIESSNSSSTNARQMEADIYDEIHKEKTNSQNDGFQEQHCQIEAKNQTATESSSDSVVEVKQENEGGGKNGKGVVKKEKLAKAKNGDTMEPDRISNAEKKVFHNAQQPYDNNNDQELPTNRRKEKSTKDSCDEPITKETTPTSISDKESTLKNEDEKMDDGESENAIEAATTTALEMKTAEPNKRSPQLQPGKNQTATCTTPPKKSSKNEEQLHERIRDNEDIILDKKEGERQDRMGRRKSEFFIVSLDGNRADGTGATEGVSEKGEGNSCTEDFNFRRKNEQNKWRKKQRSSSSKPSVTKRDSSSDNEGRVTEQKKNSVNSRSRLPVASSNVRKTEKIDSQRFKEFGPIISNKNERGGGGGGGGERKAEGKLYRNRSLDGQTRKVKEKKRYNSKERDSSEDNSCKLPKPNEQKQQRSVGTVQVPASDASRKTEDRKPETRQQSTSGSKCEGGSENREARKPQAGGFGYGDKEQDLKNDNAIDKFESKFDFEHSSHNENAIDEFGSRFEVEHSSTEDNEINDWLEQIQKSPSKVNRRGVKCGLVSLSDNQIHFHSGASSIEINIGSGSSANESNINNKNKSWFVKIDEKSDSTSKCLESKNSTNSPLTNNEEEKTYNINKNVSLITNEDHFKAAKDTNLIQLHPDNGKQNKEIKQLPKEANEIISNNKLLIESKVYNKSTEPINCDLKDNDAIKRNDILKELDTKSSSKNVDPKQNENQQKLQNKSKDAASETNCTNNIVNYSPKKTKDDKVNKNESKISDTILKIARRESKEVENIQNNLDEYPTKEEHNKTSYKQKINNESPDKIKTCLIKTTHENRKTNDNLHLLEIIRHDNEPSLELEEKAISVSTTPKVDENKIKNQVLKNDITKQTQDKIFEENKLKKNPQLEVTPKAAIAAPNTQDKNDFNLHFANEGEILKPNKIISENDSNDAMQHQCLKTDTNLNCIKIDEPSQKEIKIQSIASEIEANRISEDKNSAENHQADLMKNLKYLQLAAYRSTAASEPEKTKELNLPSTQEEILKNFSALGKTLKKRSPHFGVKYNLTAKAKKKENTDECVTKPNPSQFSSIPVLYHKIHHGDSNISETDCNYLEQKLKSSLQHSKTEIRHLPSHIPLAYPPSPKKRYKVTTNQKIENPDVTDNLKLTQESESFGDDKNDNKDSHSPSRSSRKSEATNKNETKVTTQIDEKSTTQYPSTSKEKKSRPGTPKRESIRKTSSSFQSDTLPKKSTSHHESTEKASPLSDDPLPKCDAVDINPKTTTFVEETHTAQDTDEKEFSSETQFDATTHNQHHTDTKQDNALTLSEDQEDLSSISEWSSGIFSLPPTEDSMSKDGLSVRSNVSLVDADDEGHLDGNHHYLPQCLRDADRLYSIERDQYGVSQNDDIFSYQSDRSENESIISVVPRVGGVGGDGDQIESGSDNVNRQYLPHPISRPSKQQQPKNNQIYSTKNKPKKRSNMAAASAVTGEGFGKSASHLNITHVQLSRLSAPVRQVRSDLQQLRDNWSGSKSPETLTRHVNTRQLSPIHKKRFVRHAVPAATTARRDSHHHRNYANKFYYKSDITAAQDDQASAVRRRPTSASYKKRHYVREHLLPTSPVAGRKSYPKLPTAPKANKSSDHNVLQLAVWPPERHSDDLEDELEPQLGSNKKAFSRRRSLTVKMNDLPSWLLKLDHPNDVTEDHKMSKRHLLAVLRMLRVRRRKARRIYQDCFCYYRYLKERQGLYGRHGGASEMWKRKFADEVRESHMLKQHCQRLQQHVELIRHPFNKDVPYNLVLDPSNEASYKMAATKLVNEIEELSREVETAKIKLVAESKLRTEVEREAKLLRSEAVDRKIDATVIRSHAFGPPSELETAQWVLKTALPPTPLLVGELTDYDGPTYVESIASASGTTSMKTSPLDDTELHRKSSLGEISQ